VLDPEGPPRAFMPSGRIQPVEKRGSAQLLCTVFRF
jgi:hypothetical protein